MANLVKEVRLILSDIVSNKNKSWSGKLFDDGTVITSWSRVGKAEQSKTFPNAGERFLVKKKAEKIKKGYTELETISTNQTKEISLNGDLRNIASEQIKIANPTLKDLVDKLVGWNIHKITSSTQITYDAGTGLFSTPLGIVTRDGIDRARILLADLNIKWNKGEKDRSFFSTCNKYFRIIPQDVGMKFDIDAIFGGENAFQKQSDLLDSLASSYDAMKSTPVVATATEGKSKEQVFDVELDVVSDEEFDRISKKYRDTRKDMHVCAHLKVKKAYKICIRPMKEAFDKTAPKIGGIQELWHGTNKANLLSILKNGLKISPPSTAKITAKMFGNGIYFAKDSTKSLNYSYGFWSGSREDNCFMFLSSVALGKYFTPTSERERLKLKSSFHKYYGEDGYNSTWAKSGESGVRNDEIIIYDENQCNLDYLIEFAP